MIPAAFSGEAIQALWYQRNTDFIIFRKCLFHCNRRTDHPVSHGKKGKQWLAGRNRKIKRGKVNHVGGTVCPWYQQ